MRRVLIPFLILAIILSVPNVSQVSDSQFGDDSQNRPISNAVVLSSAGSGGSDINTVQYMSRALSGRQLIVDNSYIDATHNGIIDLSSYQVSGWTLYAADVDNTTITAIAERETMGITPNTYVSIQNYTGVPPPPVGTVTDALYQQFYDLPHDGRLENYSFTYKSPYYDISLNRAWLVVRSDYNDPLTNTTGWIDPFSQSFSDQIATHDVSGDNAILSASTPYYVVIDGRAMNGFYAGGWWFNTIQWAASNLGAGISDTGYNIRGDNWYVFSGGLPHQAELNYTYTPWNVTSGSAILYPSAEYITLEGNSTFLAGTSWSFASGTNITQISFQSNQSVEIDYDLKLWYKKTGSASTNWNSQTPGPIINWNATTIVSYPVLTGTLTQFLNYSVQTDWVPAALYDGNTPVVGTHTKYGSTVHCTDMNDGTWTLSSDAPNYVGNIDLTGVTDGKVSILTDMDIDATIEDGVGSPMTGGDTNLTVHRAGSSVYTLDEVAASGGTASFIWDIDSTTLGNSTHSIEVWWTNGLEAGYNVTQVFVYYPTTLVADDYSITAYTDNVFDIGIDFNQTFPVRGLDTPIANVTYSFGSLFNDTMTNIGGGRWTKTVSTSSMISGTYPLTVYAEGFALENQSLIISVDLTIETQALNWSWIPNNDITFLQSTNLTVTYQDWSNTTIPDAWMNITFDSTTYDMKWDALSELYWIQLNGSDFLTVPGTTIMTLNAWKAGYTAQYNDTISITISEESTGIGLVVDWNPIDRNITYIEQVTIIATYTFNSVPINDTVDGVWVRVTFSGYPLVNMTYNGVSEQWEVTLDGSNYLGVTAVTIRASAEGFSQTSVGPVNLIVTEDIPSLTNSWTASSETTDYATDVSLTITVTDSSGTPITDANVSFSVFGADYELLVGAGGQYTFSNIVPTPTPGIVSFTVYVIRTGFVSDQMDLNLTVLATTTIDVVHISSEYEEWNLTVTVTYEDSVSSEPITDALVTMTLDGTVYVLSYSAGVYTTEIILEAAPGSYSIDVSASAVFAVTATSQTDFTVNSKEVVYLEVTFDGDLIAGQFMEIRATLRSNDTDNPPIPGATIRFEVSVYFDNGTVLYYTDGTMVDSTNTEGVAALGFEVPFGNVDRLTARAIYDGSQYRWNAEFTGETGVEVSPLSLLLAFFMSDIGIMMILSLALLGIVAAGYNRGVKPKKKAAKLSLENQLQMFKDLETVQHFMAVYLDRGTCVFYHPFTDERIQPDLISGFIAAITSVYGEIKGDGVRGTLEEIQYHGLRLNSYSGQYIIGILILEGEMTTLLRERLQFFVELFENQYDHDLDGWTGLVDCFDPEWVVSTLNSAFNYAWHLPHRFGPTQKVTKLDTKILDYIGAVRDDRSEFYIKNLCAPLAEMLDKTEAEVLDRLLLLQDRGIIIPIGIQTILQRQGLALVNGSDDFAAELPSTVDEPKDQKLEFEDLAEDVVDEPQEDIVEEPESDPMEDFVQDVESLLVAEAEDVTVDDVKVDDVKVDDAKEDNDDLDEFVKELRAKIGEDEDSED